jgi:hypothetical protein
MSEKEPEVSNVDAFIEYHWRRGWDEAIEYVQSLIAEMKNRPDTDDQYHEYTLEQLMQRIN